MKSYTFRVYVGPPVSEYTRLFRRAGIRVTDTQTEHINIERMSMDVDAARRVIFRLLDEQDIFPKDFVSDSAFKSEERGEER